MATSVDAERVNPRFSSEALRHVTVNRELGDI